MASVDVPVALLGYGTVGQAVNRLLNDQADDIERATGHRLRVVSALVRDTEQPREVDPGPGVLTTSFEEILQNPEISVVAEVMGGVEETGEYVLGEDFGAATRAFRKRWPEGGFYSCRVDGSPAIRM